jgi:hypothetical protein
MFKKFLFFLLAALSFCFAMSDEQVKEYIAQNSDNIAQLQGTPAKIYASSPTLLYMLYALDPAKISGLNFEWNDYEKPYIKKEILDQPVVGGFFGQGKIPNTEMLLRLNPGLILVNANSKNVKKMSEIFGSIKKPMLYLSGTKLEDYIDGFAVLGEITGKQERAKELIDYAKESLNLTEQVEKYLKENNIKRKSVYYAQGSDGLATECAGSWHASLVERAGLENVHKCAEDPNANSFGRVKISFEQLAKYDPQIILVYEKKLFDEIYSDPKWQILSAIKNKNAYYIPREPFSWFDRPPSFMRFLGLKWLINLAYPQAFKFDMNKETRNFYKLFLDIDLSDEQISKILVKG